MKHIIKTEEPKEFIEWKNSIKLTFDKYIQEGKSGDDIYSLLQPSPPKEEEVIAFCKQDLRKFLLKEQGYICCYCNQRITNNHLTIIEHLQDKSTKPELTFDYNNLLASCNGGKKDDLKPKELHCDAEKGKKSIALSPLDSNCEIQLYFTISGEIKYHCEDGKQTVEILKLNRKKLVKNRREAIEGFLFEEKDEDIVFIDEVNAKKIIDKIDLMDSDNHFIEYQSAVKSTLLREILNQKIEL